jgi:protein gp37
LTLSLALDTARSKERESKKKSCHSQIWTTSSTDQPAIALQVKPRFTKYIFVGQSESRFAELQKLKDQFPQLHNDIILVNADTNSYLQDLCLNYSWKTIRAVLFLDPFGLQIDWDTVIASNQNSARHPAEVIGVATNSAIEWTEAMWSPLTGCDKISPGCKHCYAERMAIRLQAMGQANYVNGFKLTLQKQALELPLQWRKPRAVFVNSMSDLFHKDVPTSFIHRVFEVMRKAYWHQFQVLTKRADRLEHLAKELIWSPNIWMGVSVENQSYVYRIDHLRRTPAQIKFLSLEPLLGPLPDLDLRGIDWVIVGGESGPGARPMKPEWVRDIRNQCQRAKGAFFFKQWGGVHKRKTGRRLDGRTWDDLPLIKLDRPQALASA